MFTARVPYHGLIEWSADDVDRYAATLRAEHQPHRTWVPGREPVCRACADIWPCTAHAWAEQWTHSTTRAAAQRRG